MNPYLSVSTEEDESREDDIRNALELIVSKQSEKRTGGDMESGPTQDEALLSEEQFAADSEYGLNSTK